MCNLLEILKKGILYNQESNNRQPNFGLRTETCICL